MSGTHNKLLLAGVSILASAVSSAMAAPSDAVRLAAEQAGSQRYIVKYKDSNLNKDPLLSRSKVAKDASLSALANSSERLSRQGGEAGDIAKVIAWCKAENYLDQQRFISMLVRSRVNKGYGLGYIVQECRQQNISREQVLQVMDTFGTALDKRTSMGVVGDLNRYMQYNAAESMSQPGSAMGSAMGAGMGMGMGASMAQNMGPWGAAPAAAAWCAARCSTRGRKPGARSPAAKTLCWPARRS